MGNPGFMKLNGNPGRNHINIVRHKRISMDRYRKRILIAGSWVCCVALIAGITCTWYALRNEDFHPDEPGILCRSTVVPFWFMFRHLPVTIAVLGVSGALIFAAVRKQKLWWLSIVGFIIIGVYWLYWVLLASKMPMD